MSRYDGKWFAAQETEELIAARDRIISALDIRARQSDLFPEVAPAPESRSLSIASIPTAAPASLVSSDVPEILSPTTVAGYLSCSAKWYYRKVLRLPEVRSGALALGSAVHEAVAGSMLEKMTTLTDWPIARAVDAFRASLELQLDSCELQPDESAAALGDMGDAALAVYFAAAAPSIQPAAVELPVEGVIGGVPVHGYVDILDVSGAVIDLKTTGKKPTSIAADHRLQITTYAQLAPGASGVGRRDVLTKTKTAAHYQQTFTVSPADRSYAAAIYPIVRDQMRTGIVVPNRASHLCNRKYCSFADKCVSDFGGAVD